MPTRCPAHPRSRGENEDQGCRCKAGQGSSPLTRGKLPHRAQQVQAAGLIPAHAGKTRAASGCCDTRGAHPRSRGENMEADEDSRALWGSSPLTRGKLRVQRRAETFLGLIPAHAGKTHVEAHVGAGAGAHPRSRGENPATTGLTIGFAGSSPLTRGKQDEGAGDVVAGRLIPAHAGKTPPDRG